MSINTLNQHCQFKLDYGNDFILCNCYAEHSGDKITESILFRPDCNEMNCPMVHVNLLKEYIKKTYHTAFI